MIENNFPLSPLLFWSSLGVPNFFSYMVMFFLVTYVMLLASIFSHYAYAITIALAKLDALCHFLLQTPTKEENYAYEWSPFSHDSIFVPSITQFVAHTNKPIGTH